MKMNYEVNIKISSEIYRKNRWYDLNVQKIGDGKLLYIHVLFHGRITGSVSSLTADN